MAVASNAPHKEPIIKNAVGINGENRRDQVLVVQDLLNRNLHLINNIYPLVEDGIAGQLTISAILSYQAEVMKKGPIDGRVDLNAGTHKMLKSKARPQRLANVKKFITLALKAAQEVKKRYKIPVSILMAQAALESGWGSHVKGNAYFGIKAHNTKGATTSFTTHEVLNGKKVKIKDSFRAYANFSDAAKDYGKFLTTNPRYRACFVFKNNPERFAEKLQDAGYATDPKYAAKLKAIIKKYYLDEYDRKLP